MASELGFTMAAPRPRSMAIVKNALLIISRWGRPKEIFDTPRMDFTPRSRIRSRVSRVVSAPPAVGAHCHAQAVQDNILRADAVPGGLPEDLLPHCGPPLGSLRNPLLVQAEAHNHAPVLGSQRENLLHHLGLAVYRVYEGLAVVNAQGPLHGLDIGGVNLQGEVDDSLGAPARSPPSGRARRSRGGPHLHPARPPHCPAGPPLPGECTPGRDPAGPA